MNTIDWLCNNAPGFRDLSGGERDAIMQFSLLWSLFEARTLDTNGNADAIQLTKIPPVEKYRDSFDIEFFYFEGDTTISVYQQERSLKKMIEKLSEEIVTSTPDNEDLSIQLTIS